MADDPVVQALALARAGKVEEARAAVADLVQADRDNAAAWAGLARLAKKRSEAIYCLEQVLRIQPGDEWATTHLARLAQPDAQTAPPTGETSQQAAPPADDQPSPLRGRLVLAGMAGALVAGCLLCGLAIPVLAARQGIAPFSGLLSVLSPAASEPGTARAGPTPTVPSGATPAASQTATAGDLPLTPLTDRPDGDADPTRTPRPGGGAAPTATSAARTSTPSPTPTASPTLTVTPTLTPNYTETVFQYPTPTDPPEPEDVPADEPTPVVGPCDCYGSDLDCRDFDSQAQAQACYDYCLEELDLDVFNLDDDLDDIACEAP